MTLRVSSALVIAGLLGCRSTRVQARIQPPVDTAVLADEQGVADEFPSGQWMGGSGPEPLDRVIASEAQCRYHPASWVLEQRGDTVFSWHFPASFEQGVASREPLVRTVPAIGRVKRDTIFLKDGDDRFVLRYDTVSTHLRGTRNGEPFWAVRTQELHRERCPAVP